MEARTPIKFGLGASIQRLEDETFITGRGRYTDDIRKDGELHAVVVRSPHANAGFKIDDADAAAAHPGVHLVLTGADLAHLKPLKTTGQRREPDGSKRETRDIPILCTDHVHYVGDAIAFVVADSVEIAREAAELIEVTYAELPAAVGTDRVLEDGAPLVWPELGTNIACQFREGDEEATDDAFAKAARVSRIEFVNNRLVPNYMETRAAIGEHDADTDRYTLTCGTQGVHGVRDTLAKKVMGLDPSRLRVITPDVGGGFGPKGFTFREYALVLEAAKRLGRPVKWFADRTDQFLADPQGRDHVTRAEMAMDEAGRFLALRVRTTVNMGAYLQGYGPSVPWFMASMATGVYDIPDADVLVTDVYSNTTPTDAYRGAGRPEAAFMIEKLVDECARDLGVDRVEIRRRNFIRPEQFPYDTPVGRTYERCEFDGHLTRALEVSDWTGFDARRAASARSGKYRGIGLSTYIEACAFAGSEPAKLQLREDGTVALFIGTQSNGQGHDTAYAQLAAEKLGLDPAAVEVRQGDTDELADGGGTGGSRSVPLGGASTVRAAEALAEKIRKLAADELEASEGDIELEAGSARVVGTDRAVSFSDIARKADADDVTAEGEFKQEAATFPNGTHVVEVEIDPTTGSTEILRYTIVDDFGATVNPLLLEGQVHGGIVQGIGQCLAENTVHDEDGQPVTASFMDYAMPRADIAPFFHFETRHVLSTTNALGIKGAGEAGTIGSAPAVMSAVIDAMESGCGIRHVEMPATPGYIWTLIRDATRQAAE